MLSYLYLPAWLIDGTLAILSLHSEGLLAIVGSAQALSFCLPALASETHACSCAGHVGLPCLSGLRLFAELLLVILTDPVSPARFLYHHISALSPVRPMGAVKKQVVLPESTFASPVHVGCALTTRGLYRR